MAIAVSHPPDYLQRPLTWDDLQQLPPDDGLRYELVDGVLLVQSTPKLLHQRVVTRLVVLLDSLCPPGYEVLPGDASWYISHTTVLVPDVVVVRHIENEPSPYRLEAAPMLGVEVLSPSTRLRDLGLKKHAYEDAGLRWCWVIDPDKPRLTVFRLVDDRFKEEATVIGDGSYAAVEPFSVTLSPSALVAPPGT